MTHENLINTSFKEGHEKNPVYKKMLKVVAADVSKETAGNGATYKHSLDTAEGVLERLRPVLSEIGLVATYSVRDGDFRLVDGKSPATKWVDVTVTDIETGDEVKRKSVGIGTHKNDRAMNKAIADALNTNLLLHFMLTGGIPDVPTP